MTEDIVDIATQQMGIVSPLRLTEIGDGMLLIEDPFANEEYGRVLYKEKKVQFFHVIEGDGVNRVFFDMDSIVSIHEGKIGQAEVEFANGGYLVCKKNTVIPDWIKLDDDCSFLRPNQNTLRYMVYKCYPDIEDHLYFDVLEGVPKIETSIFSDVGAMVETIPYQGKKSPAVTRMVSRLEMETRTVIDRKGQQRDERLRVSRETLDFVIKEIIDRNRKNPFVANLVRKTWDGVPRIDTFLHDIGGYTHLSEKDEKQYLAIVMRLFLMSIIERNCLEEANSIQAMLVLIGEQGSAKSQFCKRFGFDKSEKWYRETTESFDNPVKLIESAQGSIVQELVESVQIEDGSTSRAKAIVDMTNPQWRRAYAEQVSRTKIYHTMVATTNDEILLKDATGNRRFFPVFMSKDRMQKNIWTISDDEIWQLYAEAKYYFDLGERWNSNIYESGTFKLRRFILQAQQDIAEPEMGGTLIREYLDGTKPHIDDVIVDADLKAFLRETEYSFTQQDEVLSNFMHHANGYGWEKLNYPWRYKDPVTGQYTTTRRAWRRFRPPVFDDPADEPDVGGDLEW